ncbi:MAG: hypothetical protein ABSG97_10265 [Sedimentisphaerales bacterium]|jgi:hypothetical protein
MTGLLNTIKIALILAVISLAIVGTLFVLDVFTSEVAREVLKKLMKLFSIWTGTALAIFIIALLGIKKT